MEYWADVELTDQLEEWLLLQGAKAMPSHRMPILKGNKWIEGDPVVYFGGRQIYFYHGTRKVRIFFNEKNESTRTLMMLMFREAIKDHNFKDMQFD